MKARDAGTIVKAGSYWSGLSTRVANWRARRSLKELMSAEDWLLKDIGLTRSEIAWAMHLPLTVDPAEELNRVAKRSHGWSSERSAYTSYSRNKDEANLRRRGDRGPVRETANRTAAEAIGETQAQGGQITAARYPRKSSVS